jgi:hypothetical protein
VAVSFVEEPGVRVADASGSGLEKPSERFRSRRRERKASAVYI